MKKLAILFSILAATCVITSCATKSQPAPTSDTATAAPAAHHHGHDFKGEG